MRSIVACGVRVRRPRLELQVRGAAAHGQSPAAERRRPRASLRSREPVLDLGLPRARLECAPVQRWCFIQHECLSHAKRCFDRLRRTRVWRRAAVRSEARRALPSARHTRAAFGTWLSKKSIALSSRSGGTDELPPPAYISSNSGESRFKTASVVFLMRLSGWSAGTRSSGDIRHTIDDCFVSRPRIPLADHTLAGLSIHPENQRPFFSTLLGRGRIPPQGGQVGQLSGRPALRNGGMSKYSRSRQQRSSY